MCVYDLCLSVWFCDCTSSKIVLLIFLINIHSLRCSRHTDLEMPLFWWYQYNIWYMNSRYFFPILGRYIPQDGLDYQNWNYVFSDKQYKYIHIYVCDFMTYFASNDEIKLRNQSKQSNQYICFSLNWCKHTKANFMLRILWCYNNNVSRPVWRLKTNVNHMCAG